MPCAADGKPGDRPALAHDGKPAIDRRWHTSLVPVTEGDAPAREDHLGPATSRWRTLSYMSIIPLDKAGSIASRANASRGTGPLGGFMRSTLARRALRGGISSTLVDGFVATIEQGLGVQSVTAVQ